MARKILVLGDGFVGKTLHQHLEQSNRSSILAGRRDCDLRDPNATSRLVTTVKPDIIVLTSAIVRLKANSFESMVANVRMAENVVAAAQGAEHLIFLSSIDVYGNSPSNPLTINSPLQPFDNYGTSKLLSERWILAAEKLGLIKKSSILRLTGVFGPQDKGLSTMSKLIASARSGHISLSGTGSILRDFCFCPDLARLITECVDDSIGGIHNIARGKSISLSEIAELVRSTINPGAKISYTPVATENRDYNLCFDQTEFYKSFGKDSFTPLVEAIKGYGA